MADHPPYSWMMGFIRGKLNPRKRRAYLAHLLGGCQSCLNEISPIARVMFYPGRAVAPGTGGAEYEGPIHRAISFGIERSQERTRERQEAEAKLPLILSSDGRSGIDSWTWGLCEVILEKSWSFRHEDSKRMLRLAKLACEAADRLDPNAYGREQVFDMRARCWGEYASACRHHDDLVQADWGIQRALDLYKQGTGSTLLRARLSEITAGILTHQRHFQPALRALDLAYRLYFGQGQMQDAFRVLIGRGICTGRSGDPERALRLLAHALMFAEKHSVVDSRVTFMGLHNVLLFRVELGEFKEAKRQLFEMRPLYARHAGAIDTLKLRGIEAQIAAGLGEDERAEKGFLEVREEFNRRGQVYHASIAGLELAALWLRRRQLPEVRKMVDEILEVFRTRHVAREPVFVLLVLRRALEQNLATQDLIRSAVALIKLHQDDEVTQPQP